MHFHLLALDGVDESHSEVAPLAFVRAPVPTPAQLQRLVERTATRIRALVAQRPVAPEPAEVQAPLLRVFGVEPSAPAEPKLVAQFDGFNLHAGTSFEAHARVALERFCRYALRGPLAQARLSERPDGKLVYRLKAPKADGTTHVVFSPLTLLQRLSWLVPMPRIHLTRYHGVLSSAHPWRARVIPSPSQTEPPLACVRKHRWIDWADLLRRVFAMDVLASRWRQVRSVPDPRSGILQASSRLIRVRPGSAAEDFDQRRSTTDLAE